LERRGHSNFTQAAAWRNFPCLRGLPPSLPFRAELSFFCGLVAPLADFPMMLAAMRTISRETGIVAVFMRQSVKT
jgi:hypothetical protein